MVTTEVGYEKLESLFKNTYSNFTRIETISSIPSNIRLAQGKRLLINSIPELPDWVINRRKTGFSFPFQKWLEHEWSDRFQSFNPPQNIDLKLWYRRWNLMILDHWLGEINYKK